MLPPLMRSTQSRNTFNGHFLASVSIFIICAILPVAALNPGIFELVNYLANDWLSRVQGVQWQPGLSGREQKASLSAWQEGGVSIQRYVVAQTDCVSAWCPTALLVLSPTARGARGGPT